jgi:hypothetical protein
MSKPHPYYQNEKEHRELIANCESFKFNEVDDSSKLVVLIAGKEGSGKTHLSCTMSEIEPVFLIDSEYRAHIVTRKFSNVKFATAKNYNELVVAVQHIIKYQAPGTIVLDSGSDLQTFAEIEYLERSQKDKVGMPWNWAEVWRLCNKIIDDIKFAQKFNLIITARMKEEYQNDRPTGNMIPRLYNSLPYKADVVLQFTNDKAKKLVLTKNGFTGDLTVPISERFSLPKILNLLSDTKEKSDLTRFINQRNNLLTKVS